MADQPTPEQINDIDNALAAGRKIEAIKIYRLATGKSLKEAKEFIEALTVKLKAQDPDRYAKASQGAGCASAILICICVGVTLASSAWIVNSLA